MEQLNGKQWYDYYIEAVARPSFAYASQCPPTWYNLGKGLKRFPNTHSNFYGDHLTGEYGIANKRHLTMLRTIWFEAKKKAGNKPILLAGRDVFLLEVMARMDGANTIFRPDISALSIGGVKEDYSQCYCVDSGYRGSIPKKLKIEDWHVVSLSTTARVGTQKYKEELQQHQLFPHAGYNFKHMCGKLESAPKNWDRAVLAGEGIIRQTFTSLPDQAYNATVLTMRIIQFYRPEVLKQRTFLDLTLNRVLDQTLQKTQSFATQVRQIVGLNGD